MRGFDLADVGLIVGVLVAITGVWWLYPPLGMLVAGLLLIGGMLLITGRPRK